MKAYNDLKDTVIREAKRKITNRPPVFSNGLTIYSDTLTEDLMSEEEIQYMVEDMVKEIIEDNEIEIMYDVIDNLAFPGHDPEPQDLSNTFATDKGGLL